MKTLSQETVNKTKKWMNDNKEYKGRKIKWWIKFPLNDITKKELTNYYDEGYGFKRIAKQLGLTYSTCRRLFLVHLGHECRTGTSVVTEPLRERRREIAIEEGRFINWTEKYPHIQNNSKTGLQGYYQTKGGDGNIFMQNGLIMKM